MDVKISDIRITERIRKDNGDIDSLAESIKAMGLINAITLMESEGGYVLIAGFRRLCAYKLLGKEIIRSNILSPMDAEQQLRIEIEENEARKQFTVSERVEYGEKLRAIDAEKARKRMGEHNKVSNGEAGRDRGPCLGEKYGDHEVRTRDTIAKKVGFSSGRQLDRATYVAKNRPDLMEQVDAGKKSITRAYEESKGIERKKPAAKMDLPPNMGKIYGMTGHIDSEFNRPDGFPFVLNEVETAAKYYLAEIRAAVTHYTTVMQSTENSKAFSAMLRATFYDAADALGDLYIEEEENE